MAAKLYSDGDYTREYKGSGKGTSHSEPYRSDFRRDYARLIHSSAFRRLAGKTQLFPGLESDFFRNRLTHSMEVAQVAKSIAIKLNHEEDDFFGTVGAIDTDLVEIAGLAHDLGHPPFGHNGELALDRCMLKFGGFEGNAQTLRILARLEKKATDDLEGYGIRPDGIDRRFGLDLCARTLAAVLKYDRQIEVRRDIDPNTHKKPSKGYYQSEAAVVQRIKHSVLNGTSTPGEFKTLECQIMDMADDIAYSTYDLEDAFKAKFLAPIDLLSAENSLLEAVVAEINRDGGDKVDATTVRGVIIRVFEDFLKDTDLPAALKSGGVPTQDDLIEYLSRRYRALMRIANVGYLRTKLTSTLVGDFIKGVTFKPNHGAPALSEAYLDEPTRLKVEVLKRFAYVSLILSSRLKVAEIRGQEIVTDIFETLSEDAGHNLLPDDFRSWYDCLAGNEAGQKRVICDFIAGMTDRYAVEFYARLHSETPETIYKPI